MNFILSLSLFFFCCKLLPLKDHNDLIEQKFGKKGSKLVNMSLKDFRSAMDNLVSKMKPNLQKTTGQRLLKDYSPWLSGFQAYKYTETIEIPG